MLEEFSEEFEDVQVVSVTKERVDGENVETESEPIDESMIVRPITPSTLKHLPEGVYTTQDKRFYAVGSPEYKEKDCIIQKNIRYMIKDISDRSNEGNFTIYYGKE